MIPGRRLTLINVQAGTGVLLYRVSRGRDNFSLDSSSNCITFSPDGNFLTSRGREVLFDNNIFVLVVFVNCEHISMVRFAFGRLIVARLLPSVR